MVNAFTFSQHVEIGGGVDIRVNQPDPAKYPGEVIIEFDSYSTRAYEGNSELRIGFGYDISTDAVGYVDRVIEALQEVRTGLLSELAKQGKAPPPRLAIVAEGGGDNHEHVTWNDPDSSPTYRSDMRDAGRGDLLR